MRKDTWNIHDFRGLVGNYKYDDIVKQRINEYTDTIGWQFLRKNYHHQRGIEHLKALEGKGIVTGEMRAYAVQDTIFEVCAAIHVLHSLGDVFAQVVSLIFINEFTIDENDVSLWRNDNLTKKLQAVEGDDSVYKSLIALKGNHAFAYIREFNNSMKHKIAIRYDDSMKIHIPEGKMEEILVFNEFGKQKSTDVRLVRDDYLEKIVDSFVDIGNALNDYLILKSS